MIITQNNGLEYALTIINKEEKYRRLNKDITMMRSQRSDTEKNKLIEGGKRIRINKIIRQNNRNA